MIMLSTELLPKVQLFYTSEYESEIVGALGHTLDARRVDTDVFYGNTALIRCGEVDKLAKKDFVIGKQRGNRTAPIAEWHKHDIYVSPYYVGKYNLPDGIVLMGKSMDDAHQNHYLPKKRIVSENINVAIDMLYDKLSCIERPFVFYHGFPNGLPNRFP
jgi:hypothetical protein